MQLTFSQLDCVLQSCSTLTCYTFRVFRPWLTLPDVSQIRSLRAAYRKIFMPTAGSSHSIVERLAELVFLLLFPNSITFLIFLLISFSRSLLRRSMTNWVKWQQSLCCYNLFGILLQRIDAVSAGSGHESDHNTERRVIPLHLGIHSLKFFGLDKWVRGSVFTFDKFLSLSIHLIMYIYVCLACNFLPLTVTWPCNLSECLYLTYTVFHIALVLYRPTEIGR